jgi:hypothetical protein
MNNQNLANIPSSIPSNEFVQNNIVSEMRDDGIFLDNNGTIRRMDLT